MPAPGRPVLQALFALRGVMLIGSIGAFVGALMMFWVGVLHLADAAHAFLTGAADPTKAVMVDVLEATDALLFGIVLVMFAFGIAVGFVFRLPDEVAAELPRWMKVEGVGQLKQVLTEIVLVVLVVIFARLVVEAEGVFTWTMLVLPLSILAVAAAIRLLGFGEGHGSSGKDPH